MAREDGGRITPEMAQAHLSEDGIGVDAEQARMILDFLYVMAEIAVDSYLIRKENSSRLSRMEKNT